ncbi:MAG: Gfo/Idh/MocA family oxidoreductase [Armatimonadetes bacterium]|nr:Gfo/Idh/MocA family oxidoreductase [Armatimonadota bacterium]
MAKRILIVGAGSIGLKQLRAFSSQNPKPHLTVIDPREEAKARARAEFGVEISVEDWDSIDIKQFDGVVICSPAPTHVPYSIRCLIEGVPVLSEKPLSHTYAAVEELLKLAEKPGAPPSGVAYVRRYHPAHEKARELVKSGRLGKVLIARVNGGQPFTTYRPDYREIYYARRDQGGGCLLDCATHFLDLVQWYMGPIEEMCGYVEHLALEGVEVEDTVALSCKFKENDALGTVHINQFQPVNENILDFAGVEGFLRVIEPEFTCKIFHKNWEDLQVERADYADALRRQARAFLAAIDGGAPMRTSFAEAAHTLQLCLNLMAKLNIA